MRLEVIVVVVDVLVKVVLYLDCLLMVICMKGKK